MSSSLYAALLLVDACSNRSSPPPRRDIKPCLTMPASFRHAGKSRHSSSASTSSRNFRHTFCASPSSLAPTQRSPSHQSPCSRVAAPLARGIQSRRSTVTTRACFAMRQPGVVARQSLLQVVVSFWPFVSPMIDSNFVEFMGKEN